ncbi:MAG: nodulation protein NfeD [Anaerolineaceae bacterium]|nr:nodulation protein NfeD [Anaerolineaceae bacterium]
MKRSYILKIGYLLSIILTLGAVYFQPMQQDSEKEPLVIKLSSTGPITPVLSDYLERGIELAEETNAQAVILELDTPGGGVELMTKIVQQIRNSSVPVIVYVSPNNAMAGSAGTIITLAGHFSAMAPESTIGAASPVGTQGEDIGETMQSKIKEALRAQVRAIAAGRSPEAIALAEDTIENAKAVTVEEALEIGLVDFKATDIDDLLRQLDGQIVEINGETITLHTMDALVEDLENTFIEQILLLLVNPNLVFILLTIGVQAILIEISNPGGWVAGFIGVVCLSLASYGLGILPVNWFGLFFLLISFVLLFMEIKAPTHGALATAGTISFIAGALVLFNSTRLPGFPKLNIYLVIGTGLVFAAFSVLLLTFALRAQRRPIAFGPESLPGKDGWAASDISKEGMVKIDGELWQAILSPGTTPIKDGDDVEVLSTKGVRLVVKKKE